MRVRIRSLSNIIWIYFCLKWAEYLQARKGILPAKQSNLDSDTLSRKLHTKEMGSCQENLLGGLAWNLNFVLRRQDPNLIYLKYIGLKEKELRWVIVFHPNEVIGNPSVTAKILCIRSHLSGQEDWFYG